MRSVVVIEDEEPFCEVVESVLEARGLTVYCAGTAALGFQMLTRRHFDLALIDVVLPDGSGIALAEVAVNENVPVLLMTGDLAALAGLCALGFPILEKPFPLAQLDHEVARVMVDGRQNLQCARDSISKLRATIRLLDDAMGEPKRLMEMGRGLVDRAASVDWDALREF